MRIARRRRRPETVDALPLGPGERLLSWAITPGGEPVVATSCGLRLPARDLLQWEQVAHVVWRRPSLEIREIARVQGDGAVHVVELADDGDLPETVRREVTNGIAWTRHVRLEPQGGARLVGRRVTGSEVLSWQVVYDAGTDPDHPSVAAQVAQALDVARRTVG